VNVEGYKIKKVKVEFGNDNLKMWRWFNIPGLFLRGKNHKPGLSKNPTLPHYHFQISF